MNVLIDGVPDHIIVHGRDIPIITDFRQWISFEMIMSGTDVEEKQKIASKLVYSEKLDKDVVEQIVIFYQCGIETKGNTNQQRNMVKPYNFEFDQYMIYTAFKQYYGIDLAKEQLHWWIFKQMFQELPDESKIKKVMMYRTMRPSSSMSKEQRRYYAEMKRIYALPDERSKADKVHSAAEILAKGMMVQSS